MGGPLRKATLGAAGAVLLIAWLQASVAAAQTVTTDDPSGERHCVVRVIDVVDNVLVTGPEECFRTQQEADRYGVDDGGSDVDSQSDGDGMNIQSDTVIGKHFTSTSYTGSSITVVGTTCAGGVWLPGSGWNNNIESSYHYCGGEPTIFWDSVACTSSDSLSIFAAHSTLSSMNNRASCVQYGW